MDAHLEQATQERAADFAAVKEWVHRQIETNRANFAHALAEILTFADANDDAETIRLIDVQKSALWDAIAAQTATLELAEAKRREAEEEAEEANGAAWYGNPYLESCHDAEVRAARREQSRLDEHIFQVG